MSEFSSQLFTHLLALTRLVALVAAFFLTAGCEKLKNTPVDVSETPLIGYWFGEQRAEVNGVQTHDRLFLHVRDDGYATYTFLACEKFADGRSSSKQLALPYMPVIRLTSVKMVVQTFPLLPKFEFTLGKWPDQNEGVWVVDGIPLHGISESERPDTEQWRCS